MFSHGDTVVKNRGSISYTAAAMGTSVTVYGDCVAMNDHIRGEVPYFWLNQNRIQMSIKQT